MKLHFLLVTVCLVGMLTAWAGAAEIQQKWIYVGTSLDDDRNVERMINLLQEAAKCGVTHVAISEGRSSRITHATADYPNRIRRVQEEARKHSIEIIPCVYPIGYGSGWLWYDGNLAAGIPAKDIPFIVKGNVAEPAPDEMLRIPNGGFEEADGDTLAGWQSQSGPGVTTFVDREIKHSGNSSLKILGKGTARVSHTFNVKPFRYYRLTVWTKSENLQANGEAYVQANFTDHRRRPIYASLGVSRNEDWTKRELTFNTFEGGEMRLSVGVSSGRSGTLWIDDLSVEPAGLLHVLRREITPLKVTSEDGSITYEEGRDFKPVADPVVSTVPFSGFSMRHEPPKIELTENSRIKDGQTLLVSYFHPSRIYQSQYVISVQEPKVFALMEQQMQLMAKVWNAPGYFMKQDEVRTGGWEMQPEGENLTPGQMLAKQTKLGYDLIKKYAPGGAYAWSDMYTPFHNARPAERSGPYYYTNGDWSGAWEGLPSDVIVMNWYSPSAENIRWFADRGHQQVLCGYYDASGTEAMKKNILHWMKVSEGAAGVIGIMYTTWNDNYRDMAEFFRLVDEYPKWATPEAQGEAQPEH